MVSALIPQYPFRGRFWHLDGLRYHYLDEGVGEPVVFVHGNPTWSFYFRRLVLLLRERRRCIAPDHIGCGLSDKPDDSRYDYHFGRRAADLGTLVGGLGIDRPVTLVLHDWGGLIGMLFAVRNPDLVGRLVLMNTAAFPLPEGKRLPTALRVGRDTAAGAFLIRGLNAFCLGASYLGCTRRRMDDAARSGYLAPYDSWEHRRAVLRFVQDIPLAPADRGFDLLREVERGIARFRDLPVQIFWGLEDFVFDHHFLARWRELLPAAEVHAFADCGHYVLEDAFEEIAPRLLAFLDRTDPGGAH